MVDAQPVYFAGRDEFKDETVRGRKHQVVFLPQPGQIVHIKEAPVVDVIRGGAPLCQTERLGLDQFMQALKALGIAFGSVEFLDILRKEFPNVSRAGD